MTRRGFTLIEAVVVGFFFLALTTISSIFSYGMRFTSLSHQRQEVHEDRMQAAFRFRAALANSERAGNSMTYPSGNPANGDLAYSAISALDNNGQVVIDPLTQGPFYQAHEVYYLDRASGQFRCARVPLSLPSTTATALSPLQITQAVAGPPTEVLCEGVTTFEACEVETWTATAEPGNPQGFRLTQQVEGAPSPLCFSIKMIR